ncbi:hypothetical protein BO221_13155 [Archangium sp. Cb G35]|nr:hypothetical protein BO221_13155 [Archangium sp. Cb G35]
MLWPALRKVLPDYPDINLEITMDYALTDIVAERYDAGVRSGGLIAKDMIAVPIGPEMRGVTVASPRYLGGRKRPETPQDLTAHRCIKLHLPTYGGLPPWGYKKGAQELRVRVEGQLVFNSINPILEAALDGFGLAQLPDALVQPLLDRGDLVEVLADYSQRFPGYHLYYPSRRQPTAAFRVIVEALRYRGT